MKNNTNRNLNTRKNNYYRNPMTSYHFESKFDNKKILNKQNNMYQKKASLISQPINQNNQEEQIKNINENNGIQQYQGSNIRPSLENYSNSKQDNPEENPEKNKKKPWYKLFGKEKKEKSKFSGKIDISKKIQKIATKYVTRFALVFFAIIAFFIVVTFIVVNLSPLEYIKLLVSNDTSSTVEKLGNFLTFRGWCTDEECQKLEEEDYYAELNETVDQYSSKYNVKLNKYLITSTLTYSDPFANKNDDADSEGLDIIDSPTNMIDFKKSKKKIKILAENMVQECVYKNGEKQDCANGDGSVDLPKDETDENGNKITYNKRYELDNEGYREYIENEFIIDYYLNGNHSIESKLAASNIAQAIYSRSLMYEHNNNNSYQKIYATCPGITVLNKDQSIMGTFPLEEYVAAVVRQEMSDGGWNEAHKAQAVVARTYALYMTDNCTTTIENSTKNQTLRFSDEDDYAKKAAEETAGKILVNDEKVFKSEYDSFCNDSDSSYYYDPKTKLHYATYTRLPNGEPNKFSITQKYYNYGSGGHGRGMSQVAAYMMSDEGSSFDKILKKFYSPSVQIVDMVSFNGSFISGSKPPVDVNELKERSKYYASLGEVTVGPGTIDFSKLYSYKMGLLSQCPWYAKSRAIEIIYYSNMDETRKYELINAIIDTSGNGGDYYDNSLKNYFERSNDYTKPMPGSIVSWTKPGDSGHVAIIESVDYENQTVVLSECMGKKGGRTWEDTDYRINTYSFYEIKYHFNSMTFNGYVYLLGKGE